MIKVFREEKKFLISVDEYLKKSHTLEQIMLQDSHNGLHGYRIRSLYFDTPFDTDFFEKQAGVELRRKIRLRIYDPGADFAMLEMKQKQGAYQMKRSLRIEREAAEDMIRGNYSVLLKCPDSFAGEIYAFMQTKCYRPKVVIEYHRKAFIAKENKIRITFDHKIEATECSFDLFCPKLNMNPVLDPCQAVLEVKYNGFLLGYLRELINSTDKSELSVSKYYLARQSAYS